MTDSTKFDLIIPYVFVNEGTTWSNDPNDTGNWTGGAVNKGLLKGSKYGISAAQFPNLDIQNLTEAEAAAIYKPNYYDVINGDNIPTPICFLMLDAGINSGSETAVKWMQALLGLKQDGNCGKITQGAINNYPNKIELCLQYSLSHILHYMQFNDWLLYKDDYSKRVIYDSMVAQHLIDAG